MDYLGVLEDDELSHLSERMTPVEFDRIALQYLKLKKVHCLYIFKVVLGGYPRCPDSHDLSECHHLYDLGKQI